MLGQTDRDSEQDDAQKAGAVEGTSGELADVEPTERQKREARTHTHTIHHKTFEGCNCSAECLNKPLIEKKRIPDPLIRIGWVLSDGWHKTCRARSLSGWSWHYEPANNMRHCF